MKLVNLHSKSYSIPLTNGQTRSGIIVMLVDEKGREAKGEVAPLPTRSRESLNDSQKQIDYIKSKLLFCDWSKDNYLQQLASYDLWPSVSFGIESALLNLFDPIQETSIISSALFMGTPAEILVQAKQREKEGYKTAKLKVSNLTFMEAAEVIDKLKDRFRLRIDVNAAWNTEDSLHFFSKYPLDAFEYVEDPLKNPKDLKHFSHPLAVDEHYPLKLSLDDLEKIPTLKALIYKPMVQGGLLLGRHLKQWTEAIGVDLVLSSSFESHVGLKCVASLAQRLGVTTPIGLGTTHYLT